MKFRERSLARLWIAVAACSTLCGCASVDPPDNNARFLRDVVEADSSYERGDLPAARRHYQRALSARSNFVPALVRLGLIEYREGNFDAATVHFTEASRLDPSNSEALYNLVLINLTEARQLMGKYLELKPDADNRRSAEELMTAIARFTPG